MSVKTYVATLGLDVGGAKDLKPPNCGRKPLLEGGSCRRITSAWRAPTREPNKEKNTSQLPRLLC